MNAKGVAQVVELNANINQNLFVILLFFSDLMVALHLNNQNNMII